MPEFVLRCLALVGRVALPDSRVPVGAYLATYDPAAHDGLGDVRWTDDPARARRFATAREALELLYAVPAARPVRLDGLPNHPLRAFTVRLEPAPDA